MIQIDEMKRLSIIIPAHDEEKLIKKTVLAFNQKLVAAKIPHEIIVVDDHSSDKTISVVSKITAVNRSVRLISNQYERGYGFTVRTGLNNFTGEYVAIVMADLSDSPEDLIKMYKKALEGYDSVFGNRFSLQSRVIDYPIIKLIINRAANYFISILFMINYRDVTNAFKLYSRATIRGLLPLLSPHFNLTVEMPLKVIVRGFSYAIIPTDWRNTNKRVSHLKIKEMGSRYFFIVLYCFVEKMFSMGDYKKSDKFI